MSPARALLGRGTTSGTESLSRLGILALATLVTLATYVAGVSIERFAEAAPLLLLVPLALASIAYGLRGGLGMGVFASLVATAWWVEQGHHGGPAWLSSRVVTLLLIGVLLGWFVDSRQELSRTLSRHRELSLDMVATANFEGYFTEVNPAFTRVLGYSPAELLAQPFMNFVHPEDVDLFASAH